MAWTVSANCFILPCCTYHAAHALYRVAPQIAATRWTTSLIPPYEWFILSTVKRWVRLNCTAWMVSADCFILPCCTYHAAHALYRVTPQIAATRWTTRLIPPCKWLLLSTLKGWVCLNSMAWTVSADCFVLPCCTYHGAHALYRLARQITATRWTTRLIPLCKWLLLSTLKGWVCLNCTGWTISNELLVLPCCTYHATCVPYAWGVCMQ